MSLTKGIINSAEKSAFKKPPGSGKWKREIPLDEDELKRQAYMIDLYLERDQLSLAVGLMREWVVSWTIWKSGNCTDIKDWLKREIREHYEHNLGAIGAAAKGAASTTTSISGSLPKGFGHFWNQLADERNKLHHHAMREDAVEAPPSSLMKVQDFWNTLR